MGKQRVYKLEGALTVLRNGAQPSPVPAAVIHLKKLLSYKWKVNLGDLRP